MTGAKLASLAGTGPAPGRSAAAAGFPRASSSPTSLAASGTRASPSSRAAVVPPPARIVANRMR